MNSQFKKGILEMCVLALLSKKDCYGYEIVEEISKNIDVSESTVYPILRRLTQDKYFTTYLQESTEGPPRKYYHMTKMGHDAIKKMKKSWEIFVTDVNAILNKR